jgi:hypothetical protein
MPAKSADVSVEYTASIFRVEEKAKQGTNIKQAASITARLLHASCWILGYQIFKTDSAKENCTTEVKHRPKSMM